jgi:hypothetical protein
METDPISFFFSLSLFWINEYGQHMKPEVLRVLVVFDSVREHRCRGEIHTHNRTWGFNTAAIDFVANLRAQTVSRWTLGRLLVQVSAEGNGSEASATSRLVPEDTEQMCETFLFNYFPNIFVPSRVNSIFSPLLIQRGIRNGFHRACDNSFIIFPLYNRRVSSATVPLARSCHEPISNPLRGLLLVRSSRILVI